MTRDAWLEFRYNQRGKPVPRIIYGTYWTEYRTQKLHSPDFGPFNVSHYIEGDEVNRSFAALEREFLPLQKQSNDATTPVTGEKKMAPKAVTGFVSANGTFFHTAEECEFYERATELGERIQAATEAVVHVLDIGNLDQFVAQIPSMLKEFVNANEVVIREYIDAKQTLERRNSSPPVAPDRPAGVDNSEDDKRVQLSDNLEVAENSSAEDNSQDIGGTNKSKTKKPKN